MREIKFRAWGYGKMFKPTTIKYMCGCMPRLDLTNLILMQYTGLKDKNDKEIYEGDIVNTNIEDKIPDFQKKRFYEIVKFEHGKFEPTNSYFDYENNILNYKVIGNIYENPELLK